MADLEYIVGMFILSGFALVGISMLMTMTNPYAVAALVVGDILLFYKSWRG